MDRKNFIKCSCGLGFGSCFGLSFLNNSNLVAAENQNLHDDKTTPLVPVDSRQIQNLLCYVEKTMDVEVTKNIFERLGAEHLTDQRFANWIKETKKNVKGYFDEINSGKDKYWEKIEYKSEEKALVIIGKKVDRCACPYAQNENPPLSLCNHCCIGFQEKMFEMLFDVAVEKVDLDESFLLGGTRCSSTIHFKNEVKI